MTEDTGPGIDRRLNDDLDRLSERAATVLRRAYLQVRGRQVLSGTLNLLFLFVLPALALELVRYLAGYAPLGLRWWHYGLLVFSLAGVIAACRLLWDYLHHSFARGSALGLFDHQLGLANRLATADEFIGASKRSGFMSAAIDDAIEPAKRALHRVPQAPETDRRWHLSRWTLLSAPGTALLLLAASWLGSLELAGAGTVALARDNADRRPGSVLAGTTGQSAALSDWNDVDSERRPGEAGGEGSAAYGPESADEAVAGPRGDEPGRQAPGDGVAGSESGGLPSGAGARPDAAAPDSRHAAAAGAGSTASLDDRETPDNPQAQRQAGDGRRPAGKTAAAERAGGSDGSDAPGNAAAADEHGGTDEAGENNGRSAGEERGGLQNREGDGSGETRGDGRPDGETGVAAGDEAASDPGSESMARGQEQGDGQGAGESEEQNEDGKGGQPAARTEQGMGGRGEGSGLSNDPIKKNRGVAAAMLALPMRDRLIGSRGIGPERVRQQQSAAREAPAASAPAGARERRGDRIGTMQRARVSGWSRDLVKNYFDGLRAEAGEPTESRTTGSDDDQGERQ